MSKIDFDDLLTDFDDFLADFDYIAGETIVSAAPGPNAADNRDLPYQNIRPSLSLVPSGASVGNGA